MTYKDGSGNHTLSFSYDSKKHPLSNIKGLNPELMHHEPSAFVNNCLNDPFNSNSKAYTYEYNADGYPTKRIQNGSVVATYEYIIK